MNKCENTPIISTVQGPNRLRMHQNRHMYQIVWCIYISNVYIIIFEQDHTIIILNTPILGVKSVSKVNPLVVVLLYPVIEHICKHSISSLY